MNDDWARPADGTKSATKLKNGNQIEKWCKRSKMGHGPI